MLWIPQVWPWCHVSCTNHDSYEACWLYDSSWDARPQCEATGAWTEPVRIQPSVASPKHREKWGLRNLRWVFIMCLLITTVSLLLNLVIALSPRTHNEAETSCRLNLGPLSLGTVHGYQVGEASCHLSRFVQSCSKLGCTCLFINKKKEEILLLLTWLSKCFGACREKESWSFPFNTQRVKRFVCRLKFRFLTGGCGFMKMLDALFIIYKGW